MPTSVIYLGCLWEAYHVRQGNGVEPVEDDTLIELAVAALRDQEQTIIKAAAQFHMPPPSQYDHDEIAFGWHPHQEASKGTIMWQDGGKKFRCRSSHYFVFFRKIL